MYCSKEDKTDQERLLELEKAVKEAWNILRIKYKGTPIEYNALIMLGASSLELSTWLKNNIPLKDDHL